MKNALTRSLLITTSILLGTSNTVLHAGKKKVRPLRILKGAVKTTFGTFFLYIACITKNSNKNENASFKREASIKEKLNKKVAIATTIPGAYLIYKGIKDIAKGCGA